MKHAGTEAGILLMPREVFKQEKGGSLPVSVVLSQIPLQSLGCSQTRKDLLTLQPAAPALV